MKRFASILAVFTALALLCGVFAVPAAAAVNTDGFAAEVVRLVNEERAKEGLPPLAGSNSKLNAAALQRAKEYAANPDLGHKRPGSRDWYTVLTEYGVSYAGAAENIAVGKGSMGGTPASVVGAWMASPPHRSSILEPAFNWIGVGVCECDGTLYWVQLFVDSSSLVDDGDNNPPGAIIGPPPEDPEDPGAQRPFAWVWKWLATLWNSIAGFLISLLQFSVFK